MLATHLTHAHAQISFCLTESWLCWHFDPVPERHPLPLLLQNSARAFQLVMKFFSPSIAALNLHFIELSIGARPITDADSEWQFQWCSSEENVQFCSGVSELAPISKWPFSSSSLHFSFPISELDQLSQQSYYGLRYLPHPSLRLWPSGLLSIYLGAFSSGSFPRGKRGKEGPHTADKV